MCIYLHRKNGISNKPITYSNVLMLLTLIKNMKNANEEKVGSYFGCE